MNEVIRLESVGKKYRLRHQSSAHYQALRDVLGESLRGLGRRLRRRGRQGRVTKEDFWALRDVSLAVKQGERLGIIGRNGAGKSTLLKLLSRITAPSAGRLLLKGRVGSLLEVGTGFHPELTGRENIYLNGAILGMKRAEIRRQFDEIVAFAEVEKFLDTPVKRYSSGMYVRLAFAVAAHLDTDILLVDEVLAVGDAQFQKKCLGKMEDITRQGRTILFVSHNMSLISALCSRAVLLNAGRIESVGEVSSTILAYSKDISTLSSIDLTHFSHSGPHEYVFTKKLSLFNSEKSPCSTFTMGMPLIARIEFTCLKQFKDVEVGLKISSINHAAIHYLSSSWEGLKQDLEPGTYVYEVTIPEILLFPGKYILGTWILRDGFWSDDHVQEITAIEVIGKDITGNFCKHNIKNTFEKYAHSGGEVYLPSHWRFWRGE
ncbi:MAG: ABC transporter ATP-binding protein [Candidatus Aminicenantes bacterium]|nr:ABC transporter ATP-binding protein [Candidatus Aminicenantes bacterium]